jgi:hypothetical protein
MYVTYKMLSCMLVVIGSSNWMLQGVLSFYVLGSSLGLLRRVCPESLLRSVAQRVTVREGGVFAPAQSSVSYPACGGARNTNVSLHI